MSLKDLERHLQMIVGIQDLDAMLDSRERMRRLYAFFTDAYRMTGDKRWLVYARHISGAGKQLNADLDRWVQMQQQLQVWTDGDDDAAREQEI